MIRNFKALGLALVAIFAMSAMVASSASAQGKLTSDGPVTLDITETGVETANSLEAFGGTTVCPGTTYTGHAYNVTPHGLIASGATTATITPHYKQENCRASGNPATVITTGCDFVFHLGASTGVDKFAVTTDVVCPPEVAGIHVQVFSSTTESTKICELTVKPQTGLSGVSVETTTNASPHDLDIVGTFQNIHVSRSGACLLDGKGSTTTTGKFNIDATVKGTDANGSATAITVTA